MALKGISPILISRVIPLTASKLWISVGSKPVISRIRLAQMSQKRAPIKMEAPAKWLEMVENIRRVRQLNPAPIDSMGCAQAHSKLDKTVDQRFQVLLSLMLSSQTKDPITWAAVQRLKEAGLGNVQSLMAAREKDIEDLIHPVGFFRRKAVYIKEAAKKIAAEFNGDIPDSVEALCTIRGVGPKMAHLCMQEAWQVNSGIGVDTHVHRISARLGWVPKSVKTPEQTREALESWMPREYWREINHLLVGFGQTICTPLRPKCADCTNNEICPSSSIKGGGGAGGRRKRESTTIKAEPDAAAATPAGDPVASSVTKSAGGGARTRSKRLKEPKLEAEVEHVQPQPADGLLADNSGKKIKLEKVELLR